MSVTPLLTFILQTRALVNRNLHLPTTMSSESPATDAGSEILTSTPVVESATTFDSPIVGNNDVPELNRKVTIYASGISAFSSCPSRHPYSSDKPRYAFAITSGSVSVDDALKPSTITIKQEDIRKALGVGEKQWVPPLSGARISHYFNPTSQRLGLSITGNGNAIVEDAAMARDPFKGEMAGFTAVVPSVTQGNLDQKLVPINAAKSMTKEQAEMMAKCKRG